MHTAAHDYCADALKGRKPKNVIEVGSRDVNGGIRHLLPKRCTYLGVDISPGPGVDLVADATTWQPDNKADTVICLEVLEHAPTWRPMIANMAHWLTPAGIMILTAACEPRAPHSAVDGGWVRTGEYYENVNPDELEDILLRVGETTVDVTPFGDVRATTVRK